MLSRNAEKYSDLIAQVLQINSENRFLTYFIMVGRILYTKKITINIDYNHVGCVPNINATNQFHLVQIFKIINTGDYFGDELS